MKKTNSSFWVIAMLSILLVIALILLFQRTNSPQQNQSQIPQQPSPMNMSSMSPMMMPSMMMPAAMFQGNGQVWPPNVLGNPYAAPLRDERYLVGSPMVPINVPTNPGYVETSYRQIGTLSPNTKGGKENDDLLILMGRPLYTNRDQWQYYAISNQRNGVKLPITVSGKNATNEYGVKEISDGNVVMVNGYNKPYRVGMYESDTIKYLPYV
jgi:Family of unknown function (DUF5755)